MIGAEGEQLGVVDVREGQRIADETGLDLVEVAPNADPPVCRVMDFGKFLYQEKKKQAEAKKKQKTFQVKEVKFRPMIDDHDFMVKFKRLVGFLEDGDKVKATVQFRGREMPRMDLGYKLLDRIAADVGERGMVESRPERAGRRLHQVISPPRKGGGKKGEAPASAPAPAPAAKPAPAPAPEKTE